MDVDTIVFKKVSQKRKDELDRKSGIIQLTNKKLMLTNTLNQTINENTKDKLIEAICHISQEDEDKTEAAKYEVMNAWTDIPVKELEEMDTLEFQNLQFKLQDHMMDVMHRELVLSERLATTEFVNPEDKEMVLKMIAEVYSDDYKKK